MVKLSIITLNYNKPQLTILCIRSLYQQYKKEFEDNQFECIIVDNHSQDDSLTLLEKEITGKKYKNILLIANKENGGFGAGNNRGVQKAKGTFVVFFNNDAQAKDNGLSHMVDYMESHIDVAILGGQLRNADNSLQASVGQFYTPMRVLMLLLGMQRYGFLDKSPQRIQKVDWVKGALLMIRKEIFEELDGFDERIFMYTEDMELCYRAKLAGYHTYFYPDILVVHAEHGSGNRTFAIVNIYKNLLYFYRKHRARSEYTFIKSLLWTKAQILVIIGRILHNAYLTDTYEKALTVLG